MKYPSQRGFTLIELLVVISLIGIMSAVALSALNEVRETAKDSAIKQQVRQLANTMELNRTLTNNYLDGAKRWFSLTPSALLASTNCAGETWTGPQAKKLQELCQSIENNIGHNGDWEGAYMYWGTPIIFPWWPPSMTNTPSEYSFAVLLNSGDWYCVGSSGSSFTGIQSMWWFTADGCPNNP